MTSGVTLSGRLTELISLSRVDELILAARDHWHLETDDECYYLGEYTPREGYTFSATNDLIINFKKPVDRRGRPEYQHKLRAIVKAATRLRDAIPLEWHTFTFVPIPPSKSKTDPLYDARLIAMLISVF